MKQSIKSHTPILAYHSIDNSGSIISTTPERFRNQMQYLKESSFNIISLCEVVTCIHENRLFPPRSVAITFDDGFKNIYDVAYPVLKEFGFKATVFLVSGYCGKNNQWEGQPGGIPAFDLMSWDEITKMADDGIDFGAHTVTHPDLLKLSVDNVTEEISNSKTMIQKHLQKDILLFAYPYGSRNEDIKKVVKDRFSGACSTELGFVTSKSDIYSLPRIDMYYFSKNNLLSWLKTPFFSHYIKFRSTLRSIRTWL